MLGLFSHIPFIFFLHPPSFLEQCRPLSPSMGSAIKHMKHFITHELAPHAGPEAKSLTEAEGKQLLMESIDKFITERVELAQVRMQFASLIISIAHAFLVTHSHTLSFFLSLSLSFSHYFSYPYSPLPASPVQFS